MPEDIYKNRRILVVDDEERMVRFIRLNLEHDGFQVVEAYRGGQAIQKLRDTLPDVILLDVMMPDIDGFEALKMIREISSVPVIMLTAKGEEDDRVRGLELGADDYVTKPFSPKELAARVRAVLRRTPEEAIQMGPEELHFGDLTVNFPKHEAYLQSKPLNLTPVEFKLLGVFIREPNRVFSRAQLIEKVLGYDFDGFDRTIDVHILNLRRKLEPDASRPRFIKTVYGSGYKFTGGSE